MPGNARRPGDILVTDDFGNDKPLALDVTVPSVQSSGVFSICARDATGLGATGMADAIKLKENDFLISWRIALLLTPGLHFTQRCVSFVPRLA